MSNLVYPFTDSEIASGYEAWYNTEEHRPNRLEKGGRKCLLGRLPQASSLLELGSGTGHFTRRSESQGLQVVGLDSSAPMLAAAIRLGKHLPYHIFQGESHENVSKRLDDF